eukprot:scaffold1040_cov376-Prasinococcus_capsulatus_cf.AAC.6
MADRILNFNQPLDIQFLDSTVHTFYASKNADERAAAEKVLKEVQEHPDAWMRVDAILESSQVENTKFFALQILEAQIKFRWNILPAEQRDGIKNYVSNLIIKLCSDEALFRAQKVFINKLNIILVQVLKHEWPAKWKSFIPDLVGASKSSETLCENSMVILKLLSEEVFDFSRGEMTQAKVSELKKSLNSEFALIHELCEFVLARSQRVELVKTTLTTLHAFLSWIPLGYIFESTLVETLLKLIASPVLRNVCLQCLTEIGGLNVGSFYDQHFLKLYTYFMKQLGAMLPEGTNLAQAYADGTDDEEAFLQNLALFFSSFLKVHVSVLEQDAEGQQALLAGLQYLLNLSYIEDTEVFKVCLDYWHHLVYDLFQSQCAIETHASPTNASPFAFNGAAQAGPGAGAGGKPSRRQLYAAPMSKLRVLMISHMAKPEEVLIVEDENGNFVRETLKDNDVLVQYKIMRETLIFLSNLDQEDTEKQMLEKLAMQLNGKEWSWNNLNTLCWAIGSISGSMAEDQENRFLVTVIRDLLNLCEIIRGKEHKAVIASNIMYVVGQYPRFLRAHWKFLKTVVNKLFEFMHETHPGVQDMAVDTFLKITQKCKRNERAGAAAGARVLRGGGPHDPGGGRPQPAGGVPAQADGAPQHHLGPDHRAGARFVGGAEGPRGDPQGVQHPAHQPGGGYQPWSGLPPPDQPHLPGHAQRVPHVQRASQPEHRRLGQVRGAHQRGEAAAHGKEGRAAAHRDLRGQGGGRAEHRQELRAGHAGPHPGRLLPQCARRARLGGALAVCHHREQAAGLHAGRDPGAVRGGVRVHPADDHQELRGLPGSPPQVLQPAAGHHQPLLPGAAAADPAADQAGDGLHHLGHPPHGTQRGRDGAQPAAADAYLLPELRVGQPVLPVLPAGAGAGDLRSAHGHVPQAGLQAACPHPAAPVHGPGGGHHGAPLGCLQGGPH